MLGSGGYIEEKVSIMAQKKTLLWYIVGYKQKRIYRRYINTISLGHLSKPQELRR